MISSFSVGQQSALRFFSDQAHSPLKLVDLGLELKAITVECHQKPNWQIQNLAEPCWTHAFLFNDFFSVFFGTWTGMPLWMVTRLWPSSNSSCEWGQRTMKHLGKDTDETEIILIRHNHVSNAPPTIQATARNWPRSSSSHLFEASAGKPVNARSGWCRLIINQENCGEVRDQCREHHGSSRPRICACSAATVVPSISPRGL